jgi:cyclopropane-fatty-acyl-phospholipid synthase
MSASLVLRTLERLERGRLEVALPGGARRAFGEPNGVAADLQVRNLNAFARVLRSGDIGFAEGYLEGDWTTSSLPRLLTLLAANRRALEGPLYGSFLGRLLQRLLHMTRANTRAGSRRNIAAHYDLGNDFYALWLDRGMTYSSALFAGDAGRTLEEAQRAKLARALQQLAPAPGGRVLEIGCGWGSFAELAAREGLRVTGLTLSRAQLEYARRAPRRPRRPAAARLPRRARPLRRRRLHRDDRGGGRALVARLLRQDRRGAAPGRPGARAGDRHRRGALRALPRGQRLHPPLHLSRRHAALAVARRNGGGGRGPLGARRLPFRPDYARTLALWRQRFLARWPEARALGYDERFRRMWEFYLAYCEAGFNAGSTDVVQYTLVKR